MLALSGVPRSSLLKALAQASIDSTKEVLQKVPGVVQQVGGKAVLGVEEVGGKLIEVFRPTKAITVTTTEEGEKLITEGITPLTERLPPTRLAKRVVGSVALGVPLTAAAVAIGVPAGLAAQRDQEFPFLSKKKITKYLPLMRDRNVAVNNRGNDGFTAIYMRKGVTKERIRNIQVGNSILHAQRYNWLKLNEKRLKNKKNQFGADGKPTNLHLTAISYAYSPVPSKL